MPQTVIEGHPSCSLAAALQQPGLPQESQLPPPAPDFKLPQETLGSDGMGDEEGFR